MAAALRASAMLTPCLTPSSSSSSSSSSSVLERQQPLAHLAERWPVHAQRLQQRPRHVVHASLSNQQLPPACGARQLCKLKRFLTTLQQFGNDISPRFGERVRSLVLGLVNSTLTIEEFHSKLQEATNFPLRPFVIPFLKANLPLLQRELLHCARLAKQTPAQTKEVSDRELHHHHHPEHLAKRPCTTSPSRRFSPGTGLPPSHPPHPPHPLTPLTPAAAQRVPHTHPAAAQRAAQPRPRPPPCQPPPRSTTGWRTWPWRTTTGTMPTATMSTAVTAASDTGRPEEVIDHRLTDREWAEEWKHLDNLLNCIMDMVEKTRRSLTVLRRCQEADREEMNHWIRRYSDVEEMKKEIHRDFLHRPVSGYLPEEIWRKAERWLELQHGGSRLGDMCCCCCCQCGGASCWNCGRKASETCSGCNTARYCGSFCQHKDWEKHHHVCGKGLQGLPGGSAVPLGTPPPSASSSSSSSSAAAASSALNPGAPPCHAVETAAPPPPPGALSLVGQQGGPNVMREALSPKESGGGSSSGASRSTTPATPTLLDAASR
ncbi:hypothetical protein CRUP_001182 [Coryphaenoides rupestris]|nr:hypothetical protein CRUP_001182 [Coryphaenoides rupestris]